MMIQIKKLFVVFLFIISVVCFLPAVAFSNSISPVSLGGSKSVLGLGLGGDYLHSGNDDENIGGAYLAGRWGINSIVNLHLLGEAGYRFQEDTFHMRAGGQIDVYCFGVATGFIMAYEPEMENRFSPGWNVDLAFQVPLERYLCFPSIGGNFYFGDKKNELIIRMTFLYNFRYISRSERNRIY